MWPLWVPYKMCFLVLGSDRKKCGWARSSAGTERVHRMKEILICLEFRQNPQGVASFTVVGM